MSDTIYRRLTDIPRSAKAGFFGVVDITLIAVAFWAALALRLSDWWPWDRMAAAGLPTLGIALAAGIGLSATTRVHAIKLAALEIRGIVRLVAWIIGVTAITAAANLVLPTFIPRTVPLIMGPVLLLLVILSRVAAYVILALLRDRAGRAEPVAVYGAGAAGLQMIAALERSSEYRPALLVDDNAALRGVMMAGLRVVGPDDLEAAIGRGRVSRVFVAIPSLAAGARRSLLRRLAALGVPVEALPSYIDMVGGTGLIDSLRPVAPEDVLGRDHVSLDAPEIAAAYKGRSVLVSGAGGSIGSELCRQIVAESARRLILLEHSEFNLYQIEGELRALAGEKGCTLVPVLGSVLDGPAAEALMRAHEVDIVLHAAAYKHVPLVEANEVPGARNNVIGTRAMAEAAQRAGVRRFILISTDKAVRPTNVMGATKRLAEMCVQDLQRRSDTAVFSMVRFGNVLGSSGSVIPLFQAQIKAGGPITLTHREVTRYFMTIPEAARLVMLAGTYASGGEVFVLDMGEPVRIFDLARRMVELSGLTVRDAENPDGDIEIEVSGLRPGEKLYEELLIGEDTLPTPHPKILRAQEGCLSEIEMARAIRELTAATERRDGEAVRGVIERTVDGYRAGETA